MEFTLSIICVCLLVICIILCIMCIAFVSEVISIKKQIRRFTCQLKKHRSTDYNSPIYVDSFNGDIVNLANELNRQLKSKKELSVIYQNREKQLHDIIAGISHDFRTPLTATSGYLQMIEKSKKLNGKEEEYLKIAIHKTNYIKSLSDDFFELTALETNKEEIVYEKVSINNIMTECLLGQYDKIQAMNLDTRFSIPEKPTIINSNVHMLERIFENLFSNSLKYAQSFIGAGLKYKNNTVTIYIFNDVADRNAIDTSKIFESFYRGKSRTKSGSGIGLYVVKQLSEQLNFNIRADFDRNGYFVIKLTYKIPD